MGTTTNHQLYNGDRTKVTCAFGKIRPEEQTLTLATAALKGATTLDLTDSALTSEIDKWNWLLFRDSDGREYLAEVTIDALSADTALTVRALDEEIPAGAVAAFPPELYDRSAADLDRSLGTESIMTFNTGGEQQTTSTTLEKSVSLPGFWHWWNPGLRMMERAVSEKKPLWLFIEYEAPSDAFSKGVVISGQGYPTSLPKTSPADGFKQSDVSFNFSGTTTEEMPVPV